MMENDIKNPKDIQELSDNELEDVAGGGIKEIVAGVTLAAMTMTGSPVSAFGLAKAMAEGQDALIEEVPAQEAYDMEYQGVATDFLDAFPEEIVSTDIEAPAEEVTIELGEDGEAPVFDTEETAFFAADEEAPSNPVFEIGSRKTFKLNELARACGISGSVEDVGVTNDADNVKFVVYTDSDGDLAIDFTRSFDEMEFAFFTAGDIETVTLVNAVIEDAETAPADAAAAAEDVDMDALKQQVRETLNANLDEGLDVAAGSVHDALAGTASEQAIDQALSEVLAEMDEAGEAPDYYQANEDDTPEEGEYVLGEDGVIEKSDEEDIEAQNEAEDTAVDRTALMNDLINTAMDASQEEGLYAALDNTFSTLAENASVLANPETGVIDTEGNQIINMTYDALSPRFDNTPEELMGAIGAAVARADEKGYLQALGGDPALVSLAAQETDSEADAATMKYIKGLFDGTLDGIGLAYPGFKPFVPLLKTLSGDIFTIGGNPNAQVLKKLDDIERQIQDAEDSIRRNTYDVVSLQAIGNKYSLVADKAEHIQEKIGNIMGNGALTDAQKLQNVADLLNNSEFGALESAMDGATKCFTSNVNDIFERQSIFDAAYTRACSTVMFSGEAIDISMPYIARQFAVYCAAYGVMNQVYNAYEQVYGFSTLTATRGKMTQRLGGTDIHGKRVGGSVAAAIESYFKGDRYVFVNRGSSNIALDRGIVVWKIKKDEKGFNRDGLNANTGAIPLTAQQVEAICSYAGSRHRSPFDFLFNDMHFAPVVSSKKKLGSDARPIVHIKDIGIGLSIPGKKIVKQKSDPNVIEVDDFTVAYEINEDAQIWKAPANTVCMVDGRQGLGSYTDGGRNKHATINALYATKEGLKTFDHQMWLAHYYSYNNVWYSERTVDLLLFQGR